MSARGWLLCGAVALCLAEDGAQAQSPDAGARPWAEGVPEKQQADALRRFRDGNRLFEQGQYAQALPVYREAIVSWDHPAIRYNIAVALIHLDQPLAAYAELERALSYGATPLRPEVYAEGLTYQKLLLGQLSRLEVICREPGAQVLLDGQTLMYGPGRMMRVISPGAHQLVASKPQFLTASRALSLVAGQVVTEEIRLVPMPRPTRTERLWPVWKPWAVIGGAAALVGLGIPLQIHSSKTWDSYDRGVSLKCPTGCPTDDIDAGLRDRRSEAELANTLAVSIWTTGAAVGIAGFVMLVLNQPHVVEETPAGARAWLAPALANGAAGLALAGEF